MKDTSNGVRNEEQNQDKSRVDAYTRQCLLSPSTIEEIKPERIVDIIQALNRGKSPGVDGITVEHLLYGKSDLLCTLLASMYVVKTYPSIDPAAAPLLCVMPYKAIFTSLWRDVSNRQ